MKTSVRFLSVFLAVTAVQALAFGGQRTPPKISWDSVPISQPYVALTFADGPSSMLTPQVLKTLADHNIKATFFVLGEIALSHPDILKQEMAAGHEIGSRSWSHSFMGDSSDDQLLADLLRTDRAIRAATGDAPLLFSPFDTSFSPVQCDTVNKQFGYKVIYWSVDSTALQDKGAAAIVNGVVSQAKPGSIIMFTDTNPGAVAALPQVIDSLTSKGYKFVTVSELIAFTTPGGQRKLQTTTYATTPRAPSTSAPASSAPDGNSTQQSPSSTDTSHPFGVSSPGMSGSTTSDPDAPNAAQ